MSIAALAAESGRAILRQFRTTRRRILLLITLVLVTLGAPGAFLHRWALSLASIVLGVCLFRLYSLVRSDAWIWMRGTRYRRVVNKKPVSWDPSQTETLAVYRDRRVLGDFFPFGVRAIVLSVAAAERRGLPRMLLRILYLGWKFYYFAPLVSVGLYITSFMPATKPDPLALELLFLSGLTLCIGCLAIAVEAALSFFTFGSWSLAYHRFDVAQQRGVSEISALAGGVITAFLSAAASMTFASMRFMSFERVPLGSGVASIPLGLYFTLTSLTGNGDAGPSDWHGFVLMSLIYIEAAAYLVIVVSLLLESLGSEPGIHLPWVRRDPPNMEGDPPETGSDTLTPMDRG